MSKWDIFFAYFFAYLTIFSFLFAVVFAIFGHVDNGIFGVLVAMFLQGRSRYYFTKISTPENRF